MGNSNNDIVSVTEMGSIPNNNKHHTVLDGLHWEENKTVEI